MPKKISLFNSKKDSHWFVSKPLTTEQLEANYQNQADEHLPLVLNPFARMDEVYAAFANLSGSLDLQGTKSDQHLVSYCLDVGELLFNYDKLKKSVTITPFDIRGDVKDLQRSDNLGNKRFGDMLNQFLDVYGSEFNLDKINRLFVIRYQEQVIGGTSPKTIFYSSGNDLSWVNIRIGNHRLFDSSACPLYQRDIAYQKFWYSLKLVVPNFRKYYQALDQYLDRSKTLLLEKNPDLFYEHIELHNGQTLLSSEKFESYFDEIIVAPGDVVEVLGFPLRKKKSDSALIEQTSDFIIDSKKYAKLNPGKPLPMALQDKFAKPFTYIPHVQWNPVSSVPYISIDSWRDNQRALPDQIGNYPWLSVSDFLEPYLVRLPFPTDRSRFYDGNLQATDTDKGFLLPLKKDFFDFFDIEDLLRGRVRLRMVPQAQGIHVTLDIPVTAPSQLGNQHVTFERFYRQKIGAFDVPNELVNQGIIVEHSFTVNIYPFIRSGRVKIPADYRLQLLESGFDSENQYEITYFQEHNNSVVSPESIHKRTVRQQNTDGSSEVHVLRREFDYFQVQTLVESCCINGILIPLWIKYNGGNKQFAFSVDFGTTSTHIEYSVDRSSPKPFDVAKSVPQVATLVAPAHYAPWWFELYLLFDLEFVPIAIGQGQPDRFPTRTAIAEPMNLSFNQQTQILADFNIPFYVERQPAGSNRITTNLKWARTSDQTERRVEAFLEELLMLIRNKVLTEGGSLDQTSLCWLYPSSMTPGQVSQLRTDWHMLYERYIGSASGRVTELLESIAPFYYYRQNQMLSASIRPVLIIDIGGGTSDVVVFERNEPTLLTSFRFAGNAVFGDAFSEYGAASHNGFVRRYADYIQALLYSHSLGNLSDNNWRMMDTNRSEDIITFWFSLEKSNEVKDKNLFSFNAMLARDEDLKIVFVLFFVALLYHVARLMQYRGVGLPGAISFSGSGCNILPIISSSNSVLCKLTQVIFEEVYHQPYPVGSLTFSYEDIHPKEVTCKGALMQSPNSRPVDTEAINYVYAATFRDEYSQLTYSDMRRPEVIGSLLDETHSFIDFFFALHRKFSFIQNLNVSSRSLVIAHQELRTHLDTSLMDGVQRKQAFMAEEYKSISNTLDVPLEETLFFFPLIGAINKLANALA